MDNPTVEPGWGWFETDYTRIPEIQRCDDDPRADHWDDKQAAAYVLYQVAQVGNPELFARALETHLVAQILHYAHQISAADHRGMEAYAKGLIDPMTFPDIPLPAKPPEWLIRAFAKEQLS